MTASVKSMEMLGDEWTVMGIRLGPVTSEVYKSSALEPSFREGGC